MCVAAQNSWEIDCDWRSVGAHPGALPLISFALSLGWLTKLVWSLLPVLRGVLCVVCVDYR